MVVGRSGSHGGPAVEIVVVAIKDVRGRAHRRFLATAVNTAKGNPCREGSVMNMSAKVTMTTKN